MSELALNKLKSAPGSRSPRKRVGRGIGSGLGKTCGKGHKGQKSRSGGSVKPGFEGGQMPYARRVPKSGFNSRLMRQTAQVRVGDLAKVDAEVLDIDTLKAAGLINKNIKFAKIFAAGELSKSVRVKGVRVTRGAREIIEKAGGTVEE